MDRITIGHGSGGKLTRDLIKDVFFRSFGNDILEEADDSALVEIGGGRIAFTTDSFVVNPFVFPGGDIGKMAVCGTINDLAVNGAAPAYLTCSFIIEEGFLIRDLETIARSMADTAAGAGVQIVAGDTKVVEKGEADGIFINTSGIGNLIAKRELGTGMIKPGDKIIINGTIGDHGLAILSQRKELAFESEVFSDCAALNLMIKNILENIEQVRFMRDPTRGGLATTLNEIVTDASFGILLEEKDIPVSTGAKSACELLGMDPLYMANEGKVIIITAPGAAEKCLSILRDNKYGGDAQVIGEVTEDNAGKVCARTVYGVTRIIDMLTAEHLPRIC
jgi:hydrogenase expression/formation protein HypE